MRILVIFVYFSVFSVDVFADSCKEVFKNQEKKEQKKVQEVSDIFKTEPFLDKKYSLLSLMSASLPFKKIANKYPALDSEKQLQLFKHYSQHRDKRSFYILLFSNLRLIYKYKFYQYKFESNDYDVSNDYFQTGVIALSRSIENFDISSGNTFATYAIQAIKNENMVYRKDREGMIRIKDTRISALIKLLIDERKINPKEYGTEDWLTQFIKKHPIYNKVLVKNTIKKLSEYNYDDSLFIGQKQIDQIMGVRVEGTEKLLDTFSHKEDMYKVRESREKLRKVYDFALREINRTKSKDVLLEILNTRIFMDGNLKTSKDIAKEFNISRQAVTAHEKNLRNKILSRFSFKEI